MCRSVVLRASFILSGGSGTDTDSWVLGPGSAPLAAREADVLHLGAGAGDIGHAWFTGASFDLAFDLELIGGPAAVAAASEGRPERATDGTLARISGIPVGTGARSRD